MDLLHCSVEHFVALNESGVAVIDRVEQLALVVGTENRALLSRCLQFLLLKESLIARPELVKAARLGTQAFHLILVARAALILHVDDVADLVRIVTPAPMRGICRPSIRVNVVLLLRVG